MATISIEEKAQRYDDALERAKDFIKGEVRYALRKGENIMCWVFPELKESEDERIRKALMQNLKERFGTKGNMGEGLDMPDVLAWLEKQGEQKPVEPQQDMLSQEKYAKAVDECVYGEQKQNINIQINSSEYINDMGGNGCYLKNTTQNPTWSKDDENKVTLFMQLVEGCDNYEELSNWLKSLKDRVQPQPKQEWSEEDETYSDLVITAIKLYYTDDKGEENPWREELLRWLKSLKERYTWKPSKEQIEALLKLEEMHVLEHEKNQENAHLYMVVKSIREQLLKLREE